MLEPKYDNGIIDVRPQLITFTQTFTFFSIFSDRTPTIKEFEV